MASVRTLWSSQDILQECLQQAEQLKKAYPPLIPRIEELQATARRCHTTLDQLSQLPPGVIDLAEHQPLKGSVGEIFAQEAQEALEELKTAYRSLCDLKHIVTMLESLAHQWSS